MPGQNIPNPQVYCLLLWRFRPVGEAGMQCWVSQNWTLLGDELVMSSSFCSHSPNRDVWKSAAVTCGRWWQATRATTSLPHMKHLILETNVVIITYKLEGRWVIIFIYFNQKHNSSIKHCFWSFSNTPTALLKTSTFILPLQPERQGTWPKRKKPLITRKLKQKHLVINMVKSSLNLWIKHNASQRLCWIKKCSWTLVSNARTPQFQTNACNSPAY